MPVSAPKGSKNKKYSQVKRQGREKLRLRRFKSKTAFHFTPTNNQIRYSPVVLSIISVAVPPSDTRQPEVLISFVCLLYHFKRSKLIFRFSTFFFFLHMYCSLLQRFFVSQLLVLFSFNVSRTFSSNPRTQLK